MEYSDLIGTPFRYGGRDRTGMDCYGVVVEWFRRAGIAIEDPVVYSDVLATESNNAFEDYRENHWEEVSGPYKEGDVLLFADNRCGVGTHCAIYLHEAKILHALKRIGVGVSPLRHYKKRIVKAYRYKVCQE